MKKIIKISSLLLITVSLIATGCSSSKSMNKSCGCPSKTGMVGYK